jgi:hypothetical protein
MSEGHDRLSAEPREESAGGSRNTLPHHLPAHLLATEWLGDMAGKIRDADDSHPVKPLYDELEQINDDTAQYHHGEDVNDVTSDQIDATELTGYVRRTLKIANALQA